MKIFDDFYNNFDQINVRNENKINTNPVQVYRCNATLGEPTSQSISTQPNNITEDDVPNNITEDDIPNCEAPEEMDVFNDLVTGDCDSDSENEDDANADEQHQQHIKSASGNITAKLL